MESHKKICDKIFSFVGKKDAQVIINSQDSALTRFADNVISQNVSNKSTEISIKLTDGKKLAKVSLNQDSEKEIENAVKNALSILKMQKPSEEILKPVKPCNVPESAKLFFEKTAKFSPSDRAKKITDLVKKCKSLNQIAFGTLENGWTRTTVSNTNGVFLTHLETSTTFSATVKDGNGFGWAEQTENNIEKINFDEVQTTAMNKARLAKNPKEIKPSRIDVLLEPSAVAEIIVFMNIYGFGARFFLECQSFMAGKIGKKVLSEKITVEDNAISGPSAGMPFDFEGIPKTRVLMIENGMARGVVHDRKTAKKANTVSTGHSLPQPNIYGPVPLNVVLKEGNTPIEKMIKNTKKGVLVTQFWYVNMVKPLKLEITGMTRNGTFLIENGQISNSIKNMRFTESLVEALNRVEFVGDKIVPINSWGRVSVPALKIKDFNFSSTTQF
jgi:predicted Zn-dependent protease